MANDDHEGSSLRERAESQTRARGADELPLDAAEAAALPHELRVHQVELEMQNEELRSTHTALDISRARYFDLYDLAPVGYITVGADGRIVEANLRACAMLQTPRGALLAQPLTRFIAASDQDIYYLHTKRFRPGGDALVCELRMKKRDGTEFWARLESMLVRDEGSGETTVRTILSDITEIRRLRDNAAFNDRMASIGVLAASVAHELNNPLTYVLYYLASLVADLPPTVAAVVRCRTALLERVGEGALAELVGEEHDKLDATALADLSARAEHASEGLQHIEKIARGLSFFSRAEPDGLVLVDVNEAARHAIQMAANEIRSHARLEIELTPVPRILASDGRLAQAFLNLLVNAAHAIPEGAAEANRITLRTWADDVGHVFASVADTGRGIPPGQREQIFEPFFTTKGAARGTGLGLTITRRIVASFGGEITVESALGEGALFVLRFPQGCAEEPAPIPGSDAKPATLAAPGARGRVLFIDDQELVRMATTRLLEPLVDRIDSVGSAEEATALLDGGAEFDVILCDVMMPGMSGIDFHRWLLSHHPALAPRLVFVTGGVFTPRTQEYLASVPNLCLEKPVRPAVLADLIAERAQAARSGAR